VDPEGVGEEKRGRPFILHSRESRMVVCYGAAWSALGGSRPREISFLANSIWLGARVVEEDLGSGPSNSS
jgi:hypothetical protein